MYAIEQRKVVAVALEANAALTNKDFNHGEIILGLAELIGRVVVETADTSIQAAELMKVAMEHASRTIQIGAQARGKSQIIGG